MIRQSAPLQLKKLPVLFMRVPLNTCSPTQGRRNDLKSGGARFNELNKVGGGIRRVRNPAHPCLLQHDSYEVKNGGPGVYPRKNFCKPRPSNCGKMIPRLVIMLKPNKIPRLQGRS